MKTCPCGRRFINFSVLIRLRECTFWAWEWKGCGFVSDGVLPSPRQSRILWIRFSLARHYHDFLASHLFRFGTIISWCEVMVSTIRVLIWLWGLKTFDLTKLRVPIWLPCSELNANFTMYSRPADHTASEKADGFTVVLTIQCSFSWVNSRAQLIIMGV